MTPVSRPTFLPPRLTVRQLALIRLRSPEVVRRDLRANRGNIRRHLEGPPYLINTLAALAIYRVPPDQALLTLQQSAAPTAA